MLLTIDINVIDEERLRTLAANRMARSGYDQDPQVHRDLPLPVRKRGLETADQAAAAIGC